MDAALLGGLRASRGSALEPGSLNVVLDRPWVMRQPDVRLADSEVIFGLVSSPTASRISRAG